ncbi:hypothetical protein ILUMI_21862 [Ignelater luminosus]|uniref:Acyltransferase 3 domain-containing protein n=1 Tax=Ignelater luminosus TaxID=2038154 RepID=A0A8K0CB85_IGNLU|nr:hypothetical protein ILUMI_21862 [Ignelater luminosus]
MIQRYILFQELISDIRNYRHDILRHGVCVPFSCLGPSSNITLFKSNHKALQEELSKCYTKKYAELGLKSTVTHMHCETHEPFYKIDTYDMLVAKCLFTIFVLVVIGSFYEGCARYKTEKEYEEITSRGVGKILTCFSLPKNWDRLRTISNSPDAVALRPFNAIRFYNMCLVITAHTSMANMGIPTLNLQYFEKLTEDPLNMLLVNGGYTTQSFFLMSGWLLSYHFFSKFEKQKDVKWSNIILLFIHRYVRLTPVFLVMTALGGTWIAHVGRGPFWDKVVGTEYHNCRKNGWSNLLYIHSYNDFYHGCLQQSWFLAADMQVLLLSSVVLTLVCKYQHRIKLILGAYLVIGTLIPGIINYVYDYDIIMRINPESMYNGMIDHKEWQETYIPPYVNISGYALGLIFGYLFYKRKGEKILTNKFYVAIWWIMSWGIPLAVIFVAIPVYKDSYQHSRMLAAIYTGLARPAHALGIALILFGAYQGVGWFQRDVLFWSPVTILGRLSFCAYLGHSFVTRIRAGFVRTPMYINFYVVLCQTLGDIALSFIFALIVCLFVEMPAAALQKFLFSPPEEKKKQASDTKKKLK